MAGASSPSSRGSGGPFGTGGWNWGADRGVELLGSLSVPRVVRLRDILFGVEGVAILRNLFSDRPETVDARVDEILRFAADTDSELLNLGTELPERSVEDGYAEWAATYDSMPNALIEVEQPVINNLLAGIPPGRALDAACGTGRITELLLESGHDVVGVDCTPEMVELARDKVPDAEFREARISELPFPDRAFDLVTCALALGHEPDLNAPVRELARVTRVGGTLIVSDIHPLALVLGGQAGYSTADGRWGFVRNHPHLHSTYLDAFRTAGLVVQDCVEPRQSPDTIEAIPWYGAAPEATIEAFIDLPMALIWKLERRNEASA